MQHMLTLTLTPRSIHRFAQRQNCCFECVCFVFCFFVFWQQTYNSCILLWNLWSTIIVSLEHTVKRICFHLCFCWLLTAAQIIIMENREFRLCALQCPTWEFAPCAEWDTTQLETVPHIFLIMHLIWIESNRIETVIMNTHRLENDTNSMQIFTIK